MASISGIYFTSNERVMLCTVPHFPSRTWECDAQMPPAANDFNASDIARQMVESSVGRGANVILGGGRAAFRAAPDPALISSWECSREDGRDLIQEWSSAQEGLGRKAEYVATAAELAEIDVDNTDSLLGKSTNIPYLNRSPKNLMSRTHDFDGIIFCSFQGCSQKSA